MHIVPDARDRQANVQNGPYTIYLLIRKSAVFDSRLVYTSYMC